MGTGIPNIGSSAIGDPIGKAVVEIIADDKAYTEGLKKSSKALTLFDKKTQKIAKRAGKAFIAGGAAITAALAGVVFHAAKAGDELDKMSLRTGVSVENLSRLSFAAQRSGSDVTGLETSLRFLSRGMDEASKGIGRAKDVFEDLGISIQDQDGTLRSQPEVILDVAEAISNLESETKQVAAAMDIFGARSGPGLLPLLKQGASGIEELTARADELGIVMSTEAASASAEFQDRMLELSSSFKMSAFQLGQALLPAAEKAVVIFTKLIAKFNQLPESTQKLIATTTAAGAGLSLLAGGALLLVAQLPAAIAGIKAINAALIASPLLGPLALAITTLTVGIIVSAREIKIWSERASYAALESKALERGFENLNEAMELQADFLDDVNVELLKLQENMPEAAVVLERVANIFGGIWEGGPRKAIEAGHALETMTEHAKRTGKAVSELAVTQTALDNAIRDNVNGSNIILIAQLEAEVKSLKEITNRTKESERLYKNLKRTLVDDPGETFFLRVLPEITAEAKRVAAVDIEPKGIGKTFKLLQELAKAYNELGDSIDESREKIGLTEFDAAIVARGAKAREDAADAALDNEADLLRELDRLREKAFQDEQDRIGRFNDAREKTFQDALDAGIELSETELDERAQTLLGIQKLEEDAADKKTKKNKTDLDAIVKAQEDAAAETLAAWQDVGDDIEDSFVDLFESVIRDGKTDWKTFVDDIGDIFIHKFAELAVDKTVGGLLDKLIAAGVNLATTEPGVGQRGADVEITSPAVTVNKETTGARATTAEEADASEEKKDEGDDESLLEKLSRAAQKVAPIAAIAALPVFGAIAQNQQEKQRFRDQRQSLRDRLGDLGFTQGRIEQEVSRLVERQNEEGREDISQTAPRPAFRGRGLGQRAFADPGFVAAPSAAAAPAASGFEEGDTYVRIDQFNMPPTINEMSQAELDKNTTRQIDSIARAFRRNPRARRSVAR